MIPSLGKIYRSSESGLVVECLASSACSPGLDMLFTGKVIFPGKLAQFNPVGSVLPTLNPAAFRLIGESKESFLEAFNKYLAGKYLTTVDAALEGFGGAS
jgi:hypothetical protein